MVAGPKSRKVVPGLALAFALVFSLVAAAPLLQCRAATISPEAVPADATIVLLAGAADADRRLAALHALCMGPRPAPPRVVFIGDDDEVDDTSGRAWGPLLVERVARENLGCLAPRLVSGRVRTTREELEALAGAIDEDPVASSMLVFVTSPYHRARVRADATRRPSLAGYSMRFLALPTTLDNYAPHTVLFETLRLVRDALGLGDALGRRTLDELRERTPWARPYGRR